MLRFCPPMELILRGFINDLGKVMTSQVVKFANNTELFKLVEVAGKV